MGDRSMIKRAAVCALLICTFLSVGGCKDDDDDPPSSVQAGDPPDRDPGPIPDPIEPRGTSPEPLSALIFILGGAAILGRKIYRPR